MSDLETTVSEPQRKSGRSTKSGTRTLRRSETAAAKAVDLPKDTVPAPLTEAHYDYYGLPSNPVSIYHTGPAWPLPTGPEAYPVPKGVRPIPGGHAIIPVWEKLAREIVEDLTAHNIQWSSVDPVCFAEAGKEPGPPFVWVGILPKTLSREDAEAAAVRCKDIINKYDLTDVEIGFRESVVTLSRSSEPIAPKLLDLTDPIVPIADPTADLRLPFTPVPGLPIAVHDEETASWVEGSGGLYLHTGDPSKQVLLLTARHVVFPYEDEAYSSDEGSHPPHKVLHLGPGAYKEAKEAIEESIATSKGCINVLQQRMDMVVAKGGSADGWREVIERDQKSESIVSELYEEITARFDDVQDRVLGQVVYAPPISFGTGDNGFKEDWALVELDRARFDWKTFPGNVIHLGMSQSTSQNPPIKQ